MEEAGVAAYGQYCEVSDVGGKYPEAAPGVEASKGDSPVRFQFAAKQEGDQKPADDEEDVYSDSAKVEDALESERSGKASGLRCVSKYHQKDGDSP